MSWVELQETNERVGSEARPSHPAGRHAARLWNFACGVKFSVLLTFTVTALMRGLSTGKMTDKPKPSENLPEAEADERFNRLVGKLVNTPPKPHKPAAQPKPRNQR